uniref:Copia protein n=1 Tax=Lygus hesperus TaxID=30085 RepID=A0A0A9Z9C0_LYGHE
MKASIDVNPADIALPSDSEDEFESPVRRSQRGRKPPAYYEDYEMMMALSMGVALSSEEVPKCYAEARKYEGWRTAVKTELDSLERNGTWEIVPAPSPDVPVIDTRWVFTKKSVDGRTVEKARLVARGYQQPALDDENVYSPVARMATLRMLLALAVEKDLHYAQLDAKNAFLKSRAQETIYLKPPDGLEKVRPGYVCKLIKSLYGLRSSPKNFNDFVNEKLISMGLVRSKADPCFYFDNSRKIYILVWVDDFLVVSEKKTDLKNVKKSLIQSLEMKDLTGSKNLTFLGMDIKRVGSQIHISQKSLIDKIIQHFNMTDCKIASVPVEPGLNLLKADISESNLPYRELLGSIMYLMLASRPELCFAVSYFGRFQNNYDSTHFKALKQVVRYLKGTRDHVLVFSKTNSDLKLTAYADADHGSDIIDRISVSGYALMLNSCLIVWSSKKQGAVAIASSEAEYYSLSACMMECLFIGRILGEILIDVFPVQIYEDNQSCIKMSKTAETKRSKHIDIRHHFIKDLISKKKFIVTYIPTDSQVADIFTKGLSRVKFEVFRKILGVNEMNKL